MSETESHNQYGVGRYSHLENLKKKCIRIFDRLFLVGNLVSELHGSRLCDLHRSSSMPDTHVSDKLR